jgi:DNA-binding PadR family transcriptional regulator
MKSLNKIERIILRDLLMSSEGLDAYTFWRRYHISPGQISQVLSRFVERRILKLKNDHIEITRKGQKWLIENRIKLFPVTEKPWRKCPEEFLQPQLPIQQPIVPRLSQLDKSLLDSTMD